MPAGCICADVSQLGIKSVAQGRSLEKQHKSECHPHVGNSQSPERECQERVESWPAEDHRPTQWVGALKRKGSEPRRLHDGGATIGVSPLGKDMK